MLEPVEHLRWEINGHVATLTIDRPGKRNAMTLGMYTGLRNWLLALDEMPEARVIIIRGEGPAFCAGSDVRGLPEKQGAERDIHFQRTASFFLAFSQIKKPVIAAPRGYALGGGTAITAAADFAIAEEGAIFGITEIKLGFWPCSISPIIIRAVGARRAYELLMSGRQFPAQEALDMGLVTEVHSPDGFEEGLAAFARGIAETPPLAVQLGKRAFLEAAELELEKALPRMAGYMPELLDSADAREGITAFFEKRKPKWQHD